MKTKRSTPTSFILVILSLIAGLSYLAPQTSAQEVNKSNKPDVKIKVNKEFDNKGNVTRYDSTYSYSWSGNGQPPADADSIIKRYSHKFYSGNSADSMLNSMGFSWYFDNDPFFEHQPSHDNNQLEEFFNGFPFSADSSFENSPNDFRSRDFRGILKQQQQMMDQFFQQLYFNQDSSTTTPNDTILSPKRLHEEKINTEKQNKLQSKKTDKTISV